VIVGGDTDSVYFTLPHVSSLISAFDEGYKIAKTVSLIYGHPIQLEFEKVYTPMIYLRKKCYAAMMYETPSSNPSLDIKGVAISRGDTSPYTRALQLSVINLVMSGTDELWSKVLVLMTSAIQSVRQTDPLLLVKSRKLGAEYKFPDRQVQFQVAQRMKSRGEDAPQVGERVSWLVGVGSGGIASRADIPTHVTEIDYKYYIDSQIIKPMKRILEALNPEWKKYIN
jgi:DNA polymerase elongation subunit (family B)